MSGETLELPILPMDRQAVTRCRYLTQFRKHNTKVMEANPAGTLVWSIDQLAKALSVKEQDVKEYFTDGRRIVFLIERCLAHEVLNGTLAASEGAAFDLIDKDGDKWEVRSISRSGVYFCPSYMVGSGRTFNEPGFLRKLANIKGYIVADIESFPSIPYWIIPRERIEDWWNSGRLGTMSKISRANALKLLSTTH
jgi:hypothetical protein